MKVKIGITTGWEPGTVVKGWPLIYGSKDLIDRVERAGAIPILLPIVENEELIKEYIEIIDGVIISGEVLTIKRNVMMDHNENVLYKSNPIRYRNEEKIIKAAIEKNIPILGICRGHQVLNVQQGGTMIDDDINIGNLVQHQQSNIALPPDPIHKITISKDSKLFSLIKEEQIMVNSFHRQAIKEIPTSFRVCAMTNDNHIEGIETEDERFIVGVQFHPEMLKGELWENFFINYINIVKDYNA